MQYLFMFSFILLNTFLISLSLNTRNGSNKLDQVKQDVGCYGNFFSGFYCWKSCDKPTNKWCYTGTDSNYKSCNQDYHCHSIWPCISSCG